MRSLIFSALLLAAVSPAQISVVMSQYDKERTGANLNETVLNPSNVNSGQFGKLFTRPVDSSIYALPLIASNVRMGPSRRNAVTRNLLLVCTMANTVYAFDADNAAVAAPYWQKNLGKPALGDSWIGPVTHGILGTPFLDTSTDTLYVVAKTEVSASPLDIGLFIHALDVSTGNHKFGSPVRMSFPHAGGVKTNVPEAIQRAGLLVDRRILYVGVASIVLDPNEWRSQEGYIQAFDARKLASRLGNFQTTPSMLKGGIWQAGRGLAVNSGGDVYVATAGGQYDGITNFGSSYVRLASRTLAVLDWFTPANHADLFTKNWDPGATGITLLPGTNLLLGGGKEGYLFLMNQNNMGRLESVPPQVPQKFKPSPGCNPNDPYPQYCGNTPLSAFWNLGGDGRFFIWERGDKLRAYAFSGSTQRFNETPRGISSIQPVMNGGPAVSANGTQPATGIVWAVTTSANADGTLVPATLRAFRATDVTQELYNSDQNAARDAVGNFTKFAPPVIANGKVYVPTHSNAVQVYGLLGN